VTKKKRSFISLTTHANFTKPFFFVTNSAANGAKKFTREKDLKIRKKIVTNGRTP
jgi:hypothetical protein